ncbi:flavodoxin family protein [Chryseolinea lacunae]|uniref:Flavodoxin n=1 Tax=Chryseolinea lacunae TaxID=2801331 RepID=A0ABS1KVD7_9BACT|nr:hypothetical protein [Chryseolinea lacunae]MBL0743431.1 hypothetical protein [Chryseolinea lacunae]
MKTVIVYYSYTGNNALLMRELQRRLDCPAIPIEELRKRNTFTMLMEFVFRRPAKIRKPDVVLSEFDVVIFCAPVWAGLIASPMATYLQDASSELNHYAFATLCGGRPGQKEILALSLEKLTSKKPIALEEFWVNDLLPAEQKNKVKYTTPYRVSPQDWKTFDARLNAFTEAILDHQPVPL